MELLEGDMQRQLRASMQAFPEGRWAPEVVVCKANLRRTDTARFIPVALSIADALHQSVQVMGLMGNGVVYLAFPDVSSTPDAVEALAKAITQLRHHACDVGGNLIVESAPIALKRQVDVWGDVGALLHLMKQLKAKLDASGLLNPGRFVGGI
ncbi:MAG: FAD-binding oxidoreductase [Planctomycetota bacterium]|nr:MAG: FAD-binding oxidoreductase [Planctomycetota bacterium]